MANWIPSITDSAPDAIDLFCGFGGWSTAAGYAGIIIKRALNHKKEMVEIHGSNHPHSSHYLGDVKGTHPREHPRTAIFIGSPTCTDFTQADPENVKTLANENQLRMFGDDGSIVEDYQLQYEELVAQHQGRATMFDVVRFCEYHQYKYGVIENVEEVNRWSEFPRWCADMRNLGYELQFIHINAMFCHELNGVHNTPFVPQSRDRWLCMFHKTGSKKPVVDFRPLAPCPLCEKDVKAIQVWKNPQKRWGKYGRNGQYYYACPTCISKKNRKPAPFEVFPYHFAGITAIDFNEPILKVNDPNRDKPITSNTIERIRRGLEKYGYEPIILDMQRMNNKNGEVSHVKTGSALLTPLFTQTGTASQTVCIPPSFLTSPHHDGYIKPGTEPLYTQTTADGFGVVVVPSFFAELYGTGRERSTLEPINTVTSGGSKTGLAIPPAFLLEQNGEREGQEVRTRDLTEALNTMTAGGVRTGMAVPFYVTYNGNSVIKRGDEPIPTCVTADRNAIVWPTVEPEECYYRTLRPKMVKTTEHGALHVESEIGRAQGFPQGADGYKIDKSYSGEIITEGYGNAVPPAMGMVPLTAILEAMKG